jgi:hypothetical protein
MEAALDKGVAPPRNWRLNETTDRHAGRRAAKLARLGKDRPVIRCVEGTQGMRSVH